MYVRVAVNIPADKIFSYSAPATLVGEATIGRRVLVPFGKKVVSGYILETDTVADVDNIRDIAELTDQQPFFSEQDLLFYRWIAGYYLYPLGKTLFDILPGDVTPKQEKAVALVSEPQDIKLGIRQEQLVDFLRQQGTTFVSALKKEFKNAPYLVNSLQKKGIIFLEEKEVYRCSKELPALESLPGRIILNSEQEKAVQEILAGLAERRFAPYLLHGVTGSGKTEVYLRVIEKVWELGGGVIFLVPEIALTPQLMARVKGRFKEEEMAVIHSGVTKNVRYDQWRRIQKGEVKIVIGARSALFVPMQDLRLIVVDEEHDGSYKQDDRLRYNARDMAIVKAKLSAAAVVLGSATPAVQTYFNARKKKYHYLALPERIESRALPVVKIVDMRTVRDEKAEVPILAPTLREAIAHTLTEKKQALLFLNRRGFDTVVLCPDCGYVFKCLNCELTLTHHAALGILKCHCCDYAIKFRPSIGVVTTLCPSCGGRRIRSFGLGTEKLEEEVKRIFPDARIARMDSDTTTRRGDTERILRSLARQEVDILVGTQMITKGHDFPQITLVGVVAADLSLNVPDFRAGERTFQILTQVAGRGGRGDTPGLVIVQTFNPEHYAVRRAQNHDYHGFYEEEIKLRRNLVYPPYARLVNLHFSSLRKDQGRVGVAMIGKLARSLALTDKMDKKIEILGPAEAPVAKLRGRYRWQLLLKGDDIRAQVSIIDAIRAEAVKQGLEVKVDVDPMNFM
ncbi:MAG: primosomal protein N' [Deltaproteobacteria bacterium]|nr:primosomal protein N' [Deltaproteobacteria bacterium]